MNRCSSVAMGIGLTAMAMVCADAAAQPVAAPSLCTRLAGQLRRASAQVVQDANGRNRWLRPWIAFAEPRPARRSAAYRAILPVWRSSTGLGAPTRIERLPGTDILRVTNAGACPRAMFFKGHRGAALKVLPLPRQLTRCMYGRRRDQLARVLGNPAYVESETLDDTPVDVLMLISPWRGSHWGTLCPVAVRFTYAARIKRGWHYCAADGAVCAAVRQAAPALERRYHQYFLSSATVETERRPTPRIQFARPFDGQAWALITRAAHIATTRTLSATRGAMPPWLRDFNLKDVDYFVLRLNRQRYLGAIAPLSHGIGTLFGVYRAPGAGSKTLTPLAVLRMLWLPDGVKSIEVSARRAPQGADTSFGIP